jgi:hypothetical protein
MKGKLRQSISPENLESLRTHIRNKVGCAGYGAIQWEVAM